MESVRTKYADILELFDKELPQNAEQARRVTKDYLYKAKEVSKEIVTMKLKAIRIKHREVSSLIGNFRAEFIAVHILLALGC